MTCKHGSRKDECAICDEDDRIRRIVIHFYHGCILASGQYTVDAAERALKEYNRMDELLESKDESWS